MIIIIHSSYKSASHNANYTYAETNLALIQHKVRKQEQYFTPVEVNMMIHGKNNKTIIACILFYGTVRNVILISAQAPRSIWHFFQFHKTPYWPPTACNNCFIIFSMNHHIDLNWRKILFLFSNFVLDQCQIFFSQFLFSIRIISIVGCAFVWTMNYYYHPDLLCFCITNYPFLTFSV